jgi:putative glutamine amidotransferase
MSALPVIGVTTYLETARWGTWHGPAALLPQTYVDAVSSGGGLPLLLPVLSACAADAVRAVDGLVLSGGADVDPEHYGEPAAPLTMIRPERDAWELAVLRAALDEAKPVLAICRGMQLLNVACGGTLHQHLPDVVGGNGHQPSQGVFGSTLVRITPASRLGRIVGNHLTVHCHHHQAVHELGTGLEPAAWAGDDTVEAIEHFEHDFVLGVQWHPEEDPMDGRLFRALADAAGRRASGPQDVDTQAKRANSGPQDIDTQASRR